MKKNMEGLIVKAGEAKELDLEEGKHIGKINKIEKRVTEDYKYVDFEIQLNGGEQTLKAGFPIPKEGEALSPKSLLGQAIARFTGVPEIVKDQEYDLNVVFLEKPCSFLVKKKGQYFEVDRETLKPLEEATQVASS